MRNRNTTRKYLSPPLACNANLRGDRTVSPIQQWLQAVDLILLVDVDLEGELRPVPALGPRQGPTAVNTQDSPRTRKLSNRGLGGAGRKGPIEEPCEEEGDDDEG